MFNIVPSKTAPLRADHFSGTPAGEVTELIVEDGALHVGLAEMMPSDSTVLLHLVSSGNRNIYWLMVHGYSVEDFIAIAKAYAAADFETAQRLCRALFPEEEKALFAAQEMKG